MRFLPVFLDLQAGPVLLIGAGDLARAKLRLLAAAEKIGAVELKRCTAAQACLTRAPRLVMGGNGVSGQTFVDNAAFRQYVFHGVG